MEICKQVYKNAEFTSYSFILFDNKMAVYYLSFHIKNDICFIDKLDSTGYKSQCNSKDLILTIITQYALNCRIIYCFSLSRQFYVFKNTSKKILQNLNEYWIDLFKILNKEGEVFVLTSNSKNYLKKIYENCSDIVRFTDDPITKILQNIENIKNVNLDKIFEILKCRSDFMKGSLIYLVNNKRLSKPNVNEEITLMQETKNLENLILEFSFEGEHNIRKSSEILYKNLHTENIVIRKFDRQKKKKTEEITKILTVKRKK